MTRPRTRFTHAALSVGLLIGAAWASGATPAHAATSWFVSPTGISTNAGTLASPWDLDSALAGHTGSIAAGDTIYLRGGTYTGTTTLGVAQHTSTLLGTSAAHITVRNYLKEEPVISDGRALGGNATLQINGGYTDYRDFTVTNSAGNRTTPASANFRPMAFQVGNTTAGSEGHDTRFINLVIHDAGHGFGFWPSAQSAEIYGCLIYNNGQDNDSNQITYGHGIYSENENTAYYKKITRNVVINNFGLGLHLYGSSGNTSNYNIDSNILAGNGLPSFRESGNGEVSPFPSQTSFVGGAFSNLLIDATGSYPTSTNNTINNNTLWQPSSQTGTGLWSDTNLCLQCADPGNNNGTKTITNNFVQGGYPVASWRRSSSGTFTGNTISGNNPGNLFLMQNYPLIANSTYTVNSNGYYSGSAPLFAHINSLGGTWTGAFAGWKTDTGWDAASSYSAASPTGTIVGGVNNAFEVGRGNFAVANYAGAASATLNLSGLGLVTGDTFEVRNAADWYAAPAATGTYNAASPTTSVPLTGLSVAAPTGYAYGAPNLAPAFAAFIVRKT